MLPLAVDASPHERFAPRITVFMRMTVRLRRFVWPAVTVAILGAPVVVSLAGLVPNTVETNIAPRMREWPVRAVDMDHRPQSDGTVFAGTGLRLERWADVVTHDELRLALHPSGSAPELVSGEIWFEGTTCFYRTAPGRTFVDHEYLPFRRGSECMRAFQQRPTGVLALRLVLRGSQRISLMTSLAPAAAVETGWITLPDIHSSPDGPVPVTWARSADTYGGGGRRRVELLGYVWQISGSVAWLWVAVGMALVSVFVGGVLLWPGGSEPARRPVARMLTLSAGVAGVGLGLAVLYAVLVPPLQAPDEPDFLQMFAEVVKRPDIAGETETLAKIGHLDRIMNHDDERFRPSDVGTPFARPWPPASGPPPGAGKNSVTAALWWSGLSRVMPQLGAPGSLLAIRLANTALFALCLGVATLMLLVVSRGVVTAPQTVCLTLLLVPTLPFFATYVSEFSILTLAYLWVAVAAVGLFFDTPRAYLLGLPLGLGCSIALASGRNALPFMPIVGALWMGRALLGSCDEESRTTDTRRSMWFWGGLAGGLAVYPLLSTQTFQSGLWTPDATRVSDGFRDAAELLRRYPWALVVMTPIGFATERAMAGVRRKVGSPHRAVLGAVRIVGYGAALAVVSSLIASSFYAQPLLWDAEAAPARTVWIYVAKVLHVAVTGFRLANHDPYLSTLFWGGFGWVDTIPSEAFISILIVLAAAGAVVTFALVARARRIRPAIWLMLVAIGWGAALVAYAAAAHYFHRNLHGRYLVGPYLFGLGVCWSVVAWVPRTALPGRCRRFTVAREWLLLVLIAGIHAYALRLILLRYY